MLSNQEVNIDFILKPDLIQSFNYHIIIKSGYSNFIYEFKMTTVFFSL